MDHLKTLATELKLPLWQLEVAHELPISTDIQVGSISEAAELYRKTPGHGNDDKNIVLHFWRELCYTELANATTSEALRVIFTSTPDDEVLRGEILLKRVELADSFKEIRDILRVSYSNIRVTHAAEEKWKDLTRQAIGAATTVTEALAVYRETPPNARRIKVSVLIQCLVLTTTVTEAKNVFAATNATTECRELALWRWLELASTTSELLEVYRHCFNHIKVRDKTLRKLASLHELVPA